MTNHTTNRESVAVAITTAVILMLVFGSMHRILLARLSTSTNEVPIHQSVLDAFPMRIGDWVGQDIPLDEEIVRKTSADTLISRRYSSELTSESVLLYIACGTKTSEIMIHHPEVCYPGNGWTLVDRSEVELSADNGLTLPCRLLQFSWGKLSQEKVTILHYLIVDGLPHHDVSLARSSLWRLASKVNYVAQVQIVCYATTTLTLDSASEIVSGFALDSIPAISQLFGSLELKRESDKGGHTGEPDGGLKGD